MTLEGCHHSCLNQCMPKMSSLVSSNLIPNGQHPHHHTSYNFWGFLSRINIQNQCCRPFGRVFAPMMLLLKDLKNQNVCHPSFSSMLADFNSYSIYTVADWHFYKTGRQQWWESPDCFLPLCCIYKFSVAGSVKPSLWMQEPPVREQAEAHGWGEPAGAGGWGEPWPECMTSLFIHACWFQFLSHIHYCWPTFLQDRESTIARVSQTISC